MYRLHFRVQTAVWRYVADEKSVACVAGIDKQVLPAGLDLEPPISIEVAIDLFIALPELQQQLRKQMTID